MENSFARLMISGTHSGCGKTTVFCALLQALKNRGRDVAAFKCGPDYIDPMFHARIVGAPSSNLDSFLSGEWMPALFAESAREISLAEGAMGYYDGLGQSTRHSAFDVASRLQMPAVLVVDGKGSSLSLLAAMQGFLRFREESGIRGFILNRVSKSTYEGLKGLWKEEGAKLYGYFPPLPEKYLLKSRHLGLVTAGEVENLREMTQHLARQAEQTLDVDGLIALAHSAPALKAAQPPLPKLGKVRFAVARDEAFCFYYEDNFRLLQKLGGEIVFFSPLRDAQVPQADCLYLGGGYPELYADALEKNSSMRGSIRAAVQRGVPVFAECGGFMYLNALLDGREMCGVLGGECFDCGKLVRFGYCTLKLKRDCLLGPAGAELRAHEFHYYDCTENGSDAVAVRGGESRLCLVADERLAAGFPHVHFYGNLACAEHFYRACLNFREKRDAAQK
ncbi:MAG TPA: cobyrinate a,c-diamide synthase [Candidatus Borkfalkia faecipullorum]|uniref:Cobyrinate a,c-diamide synthase n=1 Tax=Candidatus Borkfalkia faecipullorum TaxID=2838510 RepID=A0A9D1V7T8_9FIRM|nr:cobyrinate a,c-diamide synthase [Candidatus Borkfalkia faecipullorum]